MTRFLTSPILFVFVLLALGAIFLLTRVENKRVRIDEQGAKCRCYGAWIGDVCAGFELCAFIDGPVVPQK